MENLEYIFALAAILGGLVQLILIIAAIILIAKDKNAGTLLMLVGSIMMILNLVAGIVLPMLFAKKGAEFLAKSTALRQLIGQVPFIIYVLGALTLCH